MIVGNNIPVVGNGIAFGMTDGTNGYGLQFQIAANDGTPKLSAASNAYGGQVGIRSSAGNIPSNTSYIGITTDPTKSGIIVDTSNMQSVNYIIKY